MKKTTDCNCEDREHALERYTSRVKDCFVGLGEERAKRLDAPGRSIEAIEKALVENLGLEESRAHDIAFHLTDWLNEAAFLVALHFFPEKFKKENIVEGVSILLAHAPNHLAAAAKLFGIPVQDIFDVDALEEDSDLYD